MMSIKPINNIEYYKNLDQEDYYVKNETSDFWHGKLVSYFKLSTAVSQHEFEMVMTHRNPKTGITLFDKNQIIKKSGWDLTFSAPKSVSILWAIADDCTKRKLLNAHISSVQSTVEYIERFIAGIKRSKNGTVKEHAKGILAAFFTHFTSRELDPHIHTHVVIPNFALSYDGKIRALDSRKIYKYQKVIGALYRTQLARELISLGYSLEKDQESFRVSAIARSADVLFSNRAMQIRNELETRGIKSSATKAGELIKLSTRKKKINIDIKDLQPIWNQRMINLPPPVAEVSASEGITPSVLQRLTTLNSTFTQQQFEYLFLVDEVLSGKTCSELRTEIQSTLNGEEVLSLGLEEYSQIYTTQSVRDMEQRLIDASTRLHHKAGVKISHDELSSAMATFSQETGFELTEEQVNALHFAIDDTSLKIIQGSAGAGKSSVLRVFEIISREKSINVLGTTIVKNLCNNLKKETAIEFLTAARLMHSIKDNRPLLNNVDILIIDEAGQIPTEMLLDILEAAEKGNTKVILTGEDKQLDAIAHGGALSLLSGTIGCYRIEKIQRQREYSERLIVSQFRDGYNELAFKSLHEQNRLHFCDNLKSSEDCLLEQLVAYIKDTPGKQHIILASKWSIVDGISAKVRQHLRSNQVIGTKEYLRKCIVSNHKCELLLSVGDRIRFTRNDYKLNVVNGTLGIIESLCENEAKSLIFKVRLENGRTLTFDENQYKCEDGNLQIYHAYASTVFSSQGLTVDGDSFILWDGAMHRSMTYVAGSRHKNKSHWFFNKSELDEYKQCTTTSYLQTVVSMSSLKRQKSTATNKFRELSQEMSFVRPSHELKANKMSLQ